MSISLSSSSAADLGPLLPLSHDLRDALAPSGGLPLRLQDPETQKLFGLKPAEHDLPILKDVEYLRKEVRKSVDQFEQGKTLPWNMERTIAEAKLRPLELSE